MEVESYFSCVWFVTLRVRFAKLLLYITCGYLGVIILEGARHEKSWYITLWTYFPLSKGFLAIIHCQEKDSNRNPEEKNRNL